MHLRVLTDDDGNTSAGCGVVVYGRSHPFSNLDEFEKEKKKDRRKSNKRRKEPKYATSRRTYS